MELIDHLRRLGGKGGLLSYKEFIHEVLFAPGMGYYMRDRERVGRNKESDFYTAESLGVVFRKLVVAGIKRILGEEESRNFEFVEIGAEAGRGLLRDEDYGFAGFKSIGAGESIEIPQKAVVFANELLDVQAFHRLIYRDGRWQELGVRVNEMGFSEELLPELSVEIKAILGELPKESREGYRIDLPLEAEKLLEKIVEGPWNGLIVLFDYGVSWEELMHNYPEGTARAYYRHKQYNDLLANIGQQDITCHICWDRLRKVLKRKGFEKINLQRQESFFVHHASSAIEEIITEDFSSNKFNYNRQTLHEILHPGHMGHKFQVLWGKR